MYKSYTADQYRKHLGFQENYELDSVLCYGTLYEDRVHQGLNRVINDLGIKVKLTRLPHPFLRFAWELNIDEKNIWFVIGYGGAWLSEYLHWACLFGSKKNVLLGSCGGLKQGVSTGDFIVPISSYGLESSATLYNRKSPVHTSDKSLSSSLRKRLESYEAKVWQGPMVTSQAMIGETAEDIKKWSDEGYFGVEMESSTVFAVSSHFNVPCAASLYVGDNLIEGHTNMGNEYATEADIREQNQNKQLRVGLEELLS